jgi:hypothetical protein
MARISFDSLAPPVHFRFRLVHLFYATALLATSLAVFGPCGVVAAGLALFFWISAFTSASRPRAIITAIVVMVAIAVPLCFYHLSLVLISGHSATRMKCSNNLRAIGLALQKYHDVYGEFPPAYIADAQGKPMHSWRVVILPYFQDEEADAIYAKYDFSEPWDGPNNRQLLSAMPRCYACPTHKSTSADASPYTSYVAVVGDGTLWPGATSGKLADIRGPSRLRDTKRGPSNAMLVIEDSEARIRWMEPRDWTLDEAMAHLSSSDPQNLGPHRSESFFYEYMGGRHAALADGGTNFFSDGMDPRVWFACITIDGRDVPADLTSSRVVRLKKMKVANWLRLGGLVALFVLPLPWVWLNPTSSGVGKRRVISNDSDNPPADGSPS